MENKRKHLEFIQNVITRMNSNSFIVKGWAITLISALFALAGKDANPTFLFIAIVPVPAFWIVDGFLLSQERRYRALYNVVTAITDDNHVSFSMDANALPGVRLSWIWGIWSKTLITFYSTLIATTILVAYLMFYYEL